MLAKVYLSQPEPNYNGARALCEQILGQFTLLADFNDVFYQELNSEIIFAIGYESGFVLDSQGFSAEFTADAGRQDGLNVVNDNLIADFGAFGGPVRNSITSYFQSPTNSELIEVGKYLPDGFMRDADGNYGPNSARFAGNDWIVLRYADVLLMHVEAIMGNSNVTSAPEALASFQEVRNRAGLTTPVSSITKDDLFIGTKSRTSFREPSIL